MINNKFLDLINSSSNILIITHEYPDGDAVGSLCAFYHILKEYILNNNNIGLFPYINTSIPDNYDFIVKKIPLVLKKDFDIKKFDLAIVLDCGNVNRTGIELMESKIINIDHHSDNTNFGDINIVIPSACSTCEILYGICNDMGISINTNIAEAIYTGISTDTGCFKFDTTTAYTHKIVADLIEKSRINTASISEHLYYQEPVEKIKLLGLILSRMKISGDICYSYITLDDWEKTGATPFMLEGLVNVLLGIKGIEMAVLFKEIDKKTKISFRSKGRYNCQTIAHKLNGGGHKQAAGARIDEPLDIALKKVLKVINES